MFHLKNRHFALKISMYLFLSKDSTFLLQTILEMVVAVVVVVAAGRGSCSSNSSNRGQEKQ